MTPFAASGLRTVAGISSDSWRNYPHNASMDEMLHHQAVPNEASRSVSLIMNVHSTSREPAPPADLQHPMLRRLQGMRRGEIKLNICAETLGKMQEPPPQSNGVGGRPNYVETGASKKRVFVSIACGCFFPDNPPSPRYP